MRIKKLRPKLKKEISYYFSPYRKINQNDIIVEYPAFYYFQWTVNNKDMFFYKRIEKYQTKPTINTLKPVVQLLHKAINKY